MGASRLGVMYMLDHLQRQQGKNYNPIELLETIATYNADASLAIWNFLRMVNPSVTIRVVSAKDKKTADEEGQKELAARYDIQYGDFGKDYGGGLDVLVDVLTLTMLVQGALAGELEISDDLKDVLDWCPVDPRVVMFDINPDTKHVIRYAWLGGNKVDLNPEQFRFLPLDPLVGDPRGRGPLLPALESTFFQVEVLRDLKAVAHMQGQPRIHFSVLEEVAEQHVPASLLAAGRENDKRVWMNGFLTDVADAYKTLQPDDALFTWDWVTSNPLQVGEAKIDLKSLVDVVEKQVITSLKHLPMLLGRIEGSGLAHGSIQWQIFAAGVESLRTKVQAIVSWWATQTLRIWGRPSIAIVEFPKIRSQDRKTEADAEALELASAFQMLAAGWVTNEELSQKFTGHAPAREPIMMPTPVATTPPAGTKPAKDVPDKPPKETPQPEQPTKKVEIQAVELAGAIHSDGNGRH